MPISESMVQDIVQEVMAKIRPENMAFLKI